MPPFDFKKRYCCKRMKTNLCENKFAVIYDLTKKSVGIKCIKQIFVKKGQCGKKTEFNGFAMITLSGDKKEAAKKQYNQFFGNSEKKGIVCKINIFLFLLLLLCMAITLYYYKMTDDTYNCFFGMASCGSYFSL